MLLMSLVGGSVKCNGDDAVELFLDGELVDIFGFVDVDGTGKSWEYKDVLGSSKL